MAGVAACQAEAFGRETVEVGRLDVAAAIAGEIAVAEVIVEDQDDVGASDGRLVGGAIVSNYGDQRQKERERQEPVCKCGHGTPRRRSGDSLNWVLPVNASRCVYEGRRRSTR